MPYSDAEKGYPVVMREHYKRMLRMGLGLDDPRASLYAPLEYEEARLKRLFEPALAHQSSFQKSGGLENIDIDSILQRQRETRRERQEQQDTFCDMMQWKFRSGELDYGKDYCTGRFACLGECHNCIYYKKK